MELRIRFGLLLAISAALLLGCSGPKRPTTAKVTGTVKYKGNPVEGAQVSFMAEGAPRSASGKTDAQGKYQLSMFETDDGALIGKNTVTVSKTEMAAGAGSSSAEKPDAAYSQMMTKAAKGVPTATGKEIPLKYANPLTSKLQCEVKKGSNTHDINLE